MTLDAPVTIAAQRHDAVLDAAQALEHHGTERQHAGADGGGEAHAATPAGELDENARRPGPSLLHIGHAREETGDQSVEPLLEGACLLPFRLQHSRRPLTLCAEGLDLGRQLAHVDLQVPLQRAPPLQSVAHLAERVHIDASARRRFGRRHMSGQRSRQDRQPAQEHGCNQPGAQRMYSCRSPAACDIAQVSARGS